MEARKTVALEPGLWEQARDVASTIGMTPDEFASEAVRREIARRGLAQIRSEGEARRRGITDEQVDETVNQAVHDWRSEQRRR
ncbi:MAG: hypothetical protein ACRD2X_14805 [Vicinamibacteraceae bacterium]